MDDNKHHRLGRETREAQAARRARAEGARVADAIVEPLQDRVQYTIDQAAAALTRKVGDQVDLAKSYAMAGQTFAADAGRYLEACEVTLAEAKTHAEHAARSKRDARTMLLVMVGWTILVVLLFTVGRIAGMY